MIQLHHDYLMLQTSTGELLPCSAEVLAIELIGDYASELDPEMVRQAAAAVLHYFKHDLERDSVSVADFTVMLERALRGCGVKIKSSEPPDPKAIGVFDLRQLTPGCGEAYELVFFPRLRSELRRRLTDSPRLLRFEGLRGCVKQMLGAKRWSHRCQDLNDQIVEYLRQCLRREEAASSCGLVVR